MEAIHNKKSADYAKETNLYSNFEFSGLLASKFRNPVDISMAALIGTKLERLSNLLDTDRTPQNESIEDNFLDLCTYMTLWAAYRQYINKKNIEQPRPFVDKEVCGYCKTSPCTCPQVDDKDIPI